MLQGSVHVYYKTFAEVIHQTLKYLKLKLQLVPPHLKLLNVKNAL